MVKLLACLSSSGNVEQGLSFKVLKRAWSVNGWLQIEHHCTLGHSSGNGVDIVYVFHGNVHLDIGKMTERMSEPMQTTIPLSHSLLG